jgi:cation diffusion facilitator CzcD-associated flavoprotein CzcO
MMDQVSLLVVGAGPYGVSVAARALEMGIDTVVVGRPMGFWKDNMPDGMFLRSGPDWHLDAAGVATFESFLEDRMIRADEVDPVPIAVFLEYAAWFQAQKGVVARERIVTSLRTTDGRFLATLDDETELTADRVVAAPGSRYFCHIPDWAAVLPEGVAVHTCDFVRFDDMAGVRALIVGGRQSAYEWAALLGDHGAERVDIVHRHDVPRFDRVSWKFVDAYIDATLSIRGWWRSLSDDEQRAIELQFWEVGRLTLEWWLWPRLQGSRFHLRPGTQVFDAAPHHDGTTRVTLSDGERLTVDRIVLATGYRADLSRVPYLQGLINHIDQSNGFPILDQAFQSTVPGLYLPGFVSTRDFGPFFGFTKGCPAAATLIVDDILKQP